MDGAIDISIFQLVLAYIFIVILLVILKKRGISRERELIIASIRMTLQLIFTAYLLTYLFKNQKPVYTILFILVMEIFAICNVFYRVKLKLSTNIKIIIALSMSCGTLISIIYFMFIVIRISPWYDARYFIPLGGMLIGNSMTGISLGVSRLVEGMHMNKNKIETALMLGAEPKDAAKEIINNAFDSAILPTINSMVGMGIVFLPGMMTGQILAGSSPLLAIKYQLAIMMGILGGVSLTVILFVQLGYKTFFNKEKQLVIEQ